MSTLDDLKQAVAELRETRRRPTQGQALHELNLWLGEQRRQLNEEYQRRRNEIEAQPEPTFEDRFSPKVLALVGQAVAQKVSRSNIRRALGLSTLTETDEVIRLAGAELREEIKSGDAKGYALQPTGKVHSRGWPMYSVTLLDDGNTYSDVYLVTNDRTTEVERRHLRITPAFGGSDDVLDLIWSSGAAQEIWARGKESQ